MFAMKRTRWLALLFLFFLLVPSVNAAETNIHADTYHIHITLSDAAEVQQQQIMQMHTENGAFQFELQYPWRWNDGRWVELEPTKHYSRGETIVHKYSLEYRQRVGEPFTSKPLLNFRLGKDNNAENDNLTLTLYDSEWPLLNHTTTFRVDFPHALTKEQLKFELIGLSSTDFLTYELDGTMLTGSFNQAMAPGQGLLLHLTLPEGYFQSAQPVVLPGATLGRLGLILFPASVLLAFVLWWLKAKNRTLAPGMVTQVPLHLTPAEMGYLYDNSLDPSDTAALFFSWAQSNALKIEEEKQSTLVNPATFFTLHKTGELPTTSRAYEFGLFSALFDRFGKNGVVMDSMLERRYYQYAEIGENKIKEQVTQMNSTGVYETSNKPLRLLFTLLTWLTGYFTLILLGLDIFRIEGGLLQIISITISGMLAVLISLASSFIAAYLVSRDRFKLRLAVLMLLVVLAAFGFLLYSTWKGRLFLPIALGLSSSFLIGLIAGNTHKRTKYGDDVMEKILGFRTFLTQVTDNDLRSRLSNQPNLFYEYLPYAFVLGVQRQWAARFESVSLNPPSWYVSNDPFLTRFHAKDFTLRLEKTRARLTETLFSAPAMNKKGIIEPNLLEVERVGDSWKIRFK